MSHWCRRCRKEAHQHGDSWSPRGAVIARPKGSDVVVCSLCFHKARLLQGVDLSRPVTP